MASQISRFKINLAIGFIRKKPTEMHWLGYSDAVSWLNEAKTQIFQPTANFEIFKIYLYFVCLPACRKTRLRRVPYVLGVPRVPYVLYVSGVPRVPYVPRVPCAPVYYMYQICNTYLILFHISLLFHEETTQRGSTH